WARAESFEASRPDCWVVGFRRGFPGYVTTSVEQFVARGEELARLIPVESAHLHISGEGDVERLAGCPALARLRHLTFSPSRSFGPSAARALAGSPHLTRLAGLDLDFHRLGDAGLRALCAAQLPSLRSLRLMGTEVGPDGLEALGAAPFLGGL